MGKRRMAREMAVQMLYQAEMGESTSREILASFDLSDYLASGGGAQGGEPSKPAGERGEAHRLLVEAAFSFARQLVDGALENRDEIDRLIGEQADNWRVERMPAVDRNVLRLAVYEMLFDRQTPALVVMDEAIELAKKFGSEQSGRFINGLLDGLLKNRQGQAGEHAGSSPGRRR